MAKETLKVLKKEDLLKMLKEQEVEIGRLSGEVESLTVKLEESEATGRRLAWAEIEDIREDSDSVIGSIADSAIIVSNVFESAQLAADKYLEDIRGICRRMDAAKEEIESEARAQADEMLSKARSEADEMIASAKRECEQYESRKNKIVDETWENVKTKLDSYYEAHKELQELLGGKLELPKSDIQSRYENE